MYNLLRRNIIIFKQYNKKILFLTIVCVLINMVVMKTTNNYNNLFLNTIGGNHDLNNVLSITLLITINMYFIITSLYNYMFDLKFSPEIIFLKVNKKQWIISKQIYFLINSLFLNFICTGLYLIFNYNVTIDNLLIFFLINVGMKYLLQTILIILYQLFNNIGIILCVIFTLIPVFLNIDVFKLMYTSFYSNNNIYIVLLLLPIATILSFIVENNMIVKKIRRGDNND